MNKEYKTIKQTGNGEIIEKKSRFIGIAAHVKTEEEAAAFVEGVKKKYYDARHNCWAYVCGDNSEVVRASDDGEPQGTAGRPILDVITGKGLTYTCVVVTRYFGGTLLGTGGLVRAYTAAAEEAVKNASVSEMKEADMLLATVEYTEVGKLQYLFAQDDYRVADTDYGINAGFLIQVEKNRTEQLMKKITELTAGKAKMEITETKYCEFESRL